MIGLGICGGRSLSGGLIEQSLSDDDFRGGVREDAGPSNVSSLALYHVTYLIVLTHLNGHSNCFIQRHASPMTSYPTAHNK
jgi:hypothetical protein